MMDTATQVRIAYFIALQNLEYKGKTIQIFDEEVGDKNAIISIEKAIEVYILLQSQQTIENSSQDVCNYRLISDLTVKVVTKFQGVGKKSICEDIGYLVENRIKGRRTLSKLEGIDSIRLDVSRSLHERDQSHTAFSKVMIFRNYINK